MRNAIVATLLAGLLWALFAVSWGDRSSAGPLTLNQQASTLRNARAPLVYDLDDGPQRTEALAFVRQMQERFFQNTELIDAGVTPPDVLEAKLRGGFILYGTLGRSTSLAWRILERTLGPATLAGGKFSTAAFYAGGDDFRMIFVGRNPYGERPAVVYSATSNRLVADINSLFHGPSSFHLYGPGNQALDAGSFNERFALYRDPLPLEDARKDVARFFATLESVHPDLQARIGQEACQRLRGEVDSEIEVAQENGSIPVRSLARILYRAAASFGDAHTSLGWFYHPTPATHPRTTYPPFTVTFRNGRFFVDKADRGAVALEGRPLVSVGGKPIAEFLGPILDLCSGESLPFKAARFSGNQAFFWSLTEGTPESKLRVTVDGIAGKPLTLLVPAIGVDAFERLEELSGGTRSDRISWRFPDPDTGYFYYPSFRKTDENVALIDAMFKELNARKARNLVIDLRGNGGGNSSMSTEILKHLTTRKIRQYSKIRLKVSPEILARYGDSYQEFAQSVGQVVEFEGEAETLPPVPALFSGKVLVLVDNGTFSSAADFAAMVRGYGVGTLVGYETGGFAASFGDVYMDELEHSGIPFGVSHKQFFAAVPSPGDDQHGVLPDVMLDDAKLAPYSRQTDPALAFALDLVRGVLKP